MDANLKSACEYHGMFWLPGKAPKSTPGRLRYQPRENLSVSLAHAFLREDPLKSPFSFADNAYAVIHGQLIDGTPLTLLDCFVTGQAFGAGPGSPTEVLANRVIIGALIKDVSLAFVRECVVGLSSLENWLGFQTVNFAFKQEGDVSLGVDVCYRFPEPIVVRLPEHKVVIELGETLNTEPGQSTFHLKGTGYIKIEPFDPVTLEQAGNLSWPVQNLISLFVGEEVELASLNITLAEAPGVQVQRSGTASLLFLQRGTAPKKDVLAPLMIAPLNDLKENLPHILDKWFSLVARSRIALDVFFGSLYHPAPVLNLKFLTIVQSVESYHRSLGVGVYMDQVAFDRAIQQFTTQLPDEIQGDHRVSMKNRLKYGNEFSLRKRLSVLADRLAPADQQAILGDRQAFINKVVDTRNFFTHYDESARERALDGAEIHYAAERLRVFMMALLLIELDVQRTHLAEMLCRNRQIQHVLSHR